VFAPSQTAAARSQLGMRRFKTDDRDCAALTYLARQGPWPPGPGDEHEALLAAVRWRRSLVTERKIAQQRLHDQLNGLCPGLSAPDGHGRALDLAGVNRRAFLAGLIDLGGRPASARSLQPPADGRPSRQSAECWAQRWRQCLPPPADAAARIARLARAAARWRTLNSDIGAAEEEIEILLKGTDGQVLTSLPGVKTVRAAAFAAFSLPVQRFPTAGHLYSATGLAPAS
jgi:transposase